MLARFSAMSIVPTASALSERASPRVAQRSPYPPERQPPPGYWPPGRLLGPETASSTNASMCSLLTMYADITCPPSSLIPVPSCREGLRFAAMAAAGRSDRRCHPQGGGFWDEAQDANGDRAV